MNLDIKCKIEISLTNLPLPPPPPHLGGDRLIIGERLGMRLGGLGAAKTGAQVISWPSIWPPSMFFIAFSASSEELNSMKQ